MQITAQEVPTTATSAFATSNRPWEIEEGERVLVVSREYLSESTIRQYGGEDRLVFETSIIDAIDNPIYQKEKLLPYDLMLFLLVARAQGASILKFGNAAQMGKEEALEWL